MISIDNTEAMKALINARLAKQGLVSEVAVEPIYTNTVIPVGPAAVEVPVPDESEPYGMLDDETGELVAKPVQLDIRTKALAVRETYPDITNTVIEDAVVEVLETIYTNTVIKSDEADVAAPARRGPKAKTMQNPFAEYFFQMEYDDNAMPVLESKVEDALIICARNTHPNTVIPVGVLVRCMKMPAITTNTVLNCMNKTRPEEQWIGERYARTIASACRNVIGRMQRLKDEGLIYTNTVFNLEEDAQGYEAWVMAGRPPYTSSLTQHHIFTEEERDAIRKQYGVKGLRD